MLFAAYRSEIPCLPLIAINYSQNSKPTDTLILNSESNQTQASTDNSESNRF